MSSLFPAMYIGFRFQSDRMQPSTYSTLYGDEFIKMAFVKRMIKYSKHIEMVQGSG